jgi:hypothetical protein
MCSVSSSAVRASSHEVYVAVQRAPVEVGRLAGRLPGQEGAVDVVAAGRRRWRPGRSEPHSLGQRRSFGAVPDDGV